MLIVRKASFRKMLNAGGEMLAEVEVHTGQPHEPELVAYFRKAPKGYELVKVAANDADTTIDWYDNNLHEAFPDVTAALFTGLVDRDGHDHEAFAAAVLETDGVREQLERHFMGGRK